MDAVDGADYIKYKWVLEEEDELDVVAEAVVVHVLAVVLELAGVGLAGQVEVVAVGVHEVDHLADHVLAPFVDLEHGVAVWQRAQQGGGPASGVEFEHGLEQADGEGVDAPSIWELEGGLTFVHLVWVGDVDVVEGLEHGEHEVLEPALDLGGVDVLPGALLEEGLHPGPDPLPPVLALLVVLQQEDVLLGPEVRRAQRLLLLDSKRGLVHARTCCWACGSRSGTPWTSTACVPGK